MKASFNYNDTIERHHAQKQAQAQARTSAQVLGQKQKEQAAREAGNAAKNREYQDERQRQIQQQLQSMRDFAADQKDAFEAQAAARSKTLADGYGASGKGLSLDARRVGFYAQA